MIANEFEYTRTLEDLQFLEDWLTRLRQSTTVGGQGLTKVGIRKMIARLHRKLGTYEARAEKSAAMSALSTANANSPHLARS